MNQEPQTLEALLTEEEQAFVAEALEEERVTFEVVEKILNHNLLSKEDKYKLLIKEIVEPQSMESTIKTIRERVREGDHQMIAVIENDNRPSMVYTVGGYDKFKGELLFVGNVDIKNIGALFNLIVRQFEEHGFKDDIGTIGCFSETETPVRYRFLKGLIKDHIEQFFRIFPGVYPDYDPETPVYLLELADDDNRLPGEDGYDAELIQYSHLEKETPILDS